MPIQPFHPDMATEIVQLWRESMKQALAPFENLHPFDDQVRYLVEELGPRCIVSVFVQQSIIVGFMAQCGDTIEQLYILTTAQRQGIGTQFLDWAKTKSPEELNLVTFEKNHRAISFYKKSGFQEMSRGNTDNEEGLPDVQLRWEVSLADQEGTTPEYS